MSLADGLNMALATAATAATAALAVILANSILNALTFPRLRVPQEDAEPPSGSTHPAVSVLIPARDEAAVIGRTIADLRAQTLRGLEILVLDDASSDGTSEVARAAGGTDARVQVIRGEPLPAGWAGKPWACSQLAERASGELLLFTDADTRWQPGAVAALMAEQRRTGADLLAGWPTQETVSWAERLTVPFLAFTVHGYLPALAVHALPFPSMSAAVGQCLLFSRRGYDAVGGHAAFPGAVLEDMALARATKRAGRRLRLVDADGLIACRMYRDWPTVRDGFAKSMLAGFGGTLTGLLAAAAFHWLILLVPWLWLVSGAFVPSLGAEDGGPGGWWPAWPLVLITLGMAARAVTAAATRQRVSDALLLPVSALLFTAIAWRAAAWARGGGPRWKGRTLPTSGDGGAGR